MNEPEIMEQERGRGLLPPTRELANLARRLTAARSVIGSTTDPIGTIIACEKCGEPRERKETEPNATGHSIRYWSECACWRAKVNHAATISESATAAIRGTRGDENEAANPNAYDVKVLASQAELTLDTFEPIWLSDRYPYDMAVKWLADIQEREVVGNYRAGPPAALFFVGEPGRGKTHLAVALLLAVHAAGQKVAIVNEQKYLRQTQSVPFGPPMEALVAEPAERAWLTLIDDLGKQKLRTKKELQEEDKARIQNAWYAVIDRRYNRRRWTIITSEKTLDELAAHGTIDDALYSRLYEMTRGVHLRFTGDDQRLRGGA